MPRVIEDYDEFIQRHGGGLLKVGGRWLLPSGAAVSNAGLGPIRHEPPADPAECLRLRRDYYTAQVRRAERDFNTLQAALLGHRDQSNMPVTFDWPTDGRYGPCPGLDNGADALRAIRAAVERHRATLQSIVAELADTPEERERRRREEQDREWRQEQRARDAARRDEIAQIQL